MNWSRLKLKLRRECEDLKRKSTQVKADLRGEEAGARQGLERQLHDAQKMEAVGRVVRESRASSERCFQSLGNRPGIMFRACSRAILSSLSR